MLAGLNKGSELLRKTHGRWMVCVFLPDSSMLSVRGCLLKGSVGEFRRCRRMIDRSIMFPEGSWTGSVIRVSIRGSVTQQENTIQGYSRLCSSCHASYNMTASIILYEIYFEIRNVCVCEHRGKEYVKPTCSRGKSKEVCTLHSVSRLGSACS